MCHSCVTPEITFCILNAVIVVPNAGGVLNLILGSSRPPLKGSENISAISIVPVPIETLVSIVFILTISPIEKLVILSAEPALSVVTVARALSILTTGLVLSPQLFDSSTTLFVPFTTLKLAKSTGLMPLDTLLVNDLAADKAALNASWNSISENPVYEV